jgi:hypothetical protein
MWRAGRKPRGVRRRVDATGWISVDGSFGVQRCKVVDLSESGAQILADDPKSIPSTFGLSFSQADRRGRRCQVVWRDGLKIGVKFSA